MTVEKSLLGKETTYENIYNPSLLFPIVRQEKREEIGVPEPLPFQGVDIWNAYEVSWLNLKGKPEVAIAQLRIPCESPFIIESKSLKLYLNSLNQTPFSHPNEVKKTVEKDLSDAAGQSIKIRLLPANMRGEFHDPDGICLDQLECEITEYLVNPNLLNVSTEVVEERLYSHLLKSNCLVTNQPDWGTVTIHYKGPKVDHESLLKYIVSFRNHNEFHEQCIERIFMDLLNKCQPEKLTVYGQYTRRGGLDINPFRSNFEAYPSSFVRTSRQ